MVRKRLHFANAEYPKKRNRCAVGHLLLVVRPMIFVAFAFSRPECCAIFYVMRS